MIRLHHRRGFSQTHKDLSTFRSEEPTSTKSTPKTALRGVKRVEERGMRGEASGGSACSWEERQLNRRLGFGWLLKKLI
ncbi:hypothetical protein ERO13_A08G195800v2 [Gossypium hirsutum]|uniref:Uncharacterized protein n=4 Tax=Gossypium TaxID=3633 RepID=A0A5J5UUR7_GOSBA|nr:hypothetical protein ES319_A08G207600v1 [Gossypium barbadense]KAG4188947.1 hypothetical protein ERO13_A08G195800v2 [Gossypium hirsutum]TYH07397.1 hypothetical protein ES288_A08G230200v1 [Gossypium darwinii]TYI16074.1 hypothetical protein ES332_A08G229500v1 [Gossypium tomentosum]TYJ23771.1 hypothetical protein E1A91_A08G215200v1 [Gossypium mustelinum]